MTRLIGFSTRLPVASVAWAGPLRLWRCEQHASAAPPLSAKRTASEEASVSYTGDSQMLSDRRIDKAAKLRSPKTPSVRTNQNSKKTGPLPKSRRDSLSPSAIITSAAGRSDVYVSISTLVSVTTSLYMLLRAEEAELSSRQTGLSRSHVMAALSHFLCQAPEHLLTVSSTGLQAALVPQEASTPAQSAAFYGYLWSAMKGPMKRDWDMLDCFSAGRTLLEAAATAAGTHGEAGSSEGLWMAFSVAGPGHGQDSSSSKNGVGTGPRPAEQESTLQDPVWELYCTVHTDAFDAVGKKLRAALLAALGPDDAGDISQLPASAVTALAQETGLRFPNHAQSLLLFAAAFNRACSSGCGPRGGGRYVATTQWLSTVSAAALLPLPLMLVTRAELEALLFALVGMADCTRGSGWRPRNAAVCALDEALAVVALPGAPLAAVARLISLRSRLGVALPPRLVQLVDGSVLMQGGEASSAILISQALAFELAAPGSEQVEKAEAEAAAAQHLGVHLEASLMELDSLCMLMEAAQPLLPVEGGSGSSATAMMDLPGAEPSSSDCMARCDLDADVLLNKVYLAVAMAGTALWAEPRFLCRLYPRLVRSCYSLGGQPELLLVERYTAAVSDQLAQPLAFRDLMLSDVDVLCNILTVLLPVADDSGCHLDQEGMDYLQGHCAVVLAAGVCCGYIRRRCWVRLMGLMAGARLCCPQLTAVAAWAMAHPSAPFGASSVGFQRACQSWMHLLSSSGLMGSARVSMAAAGVAGVQLDPLPAAWDWPERPGVEGSASPGVGGVRATSCLAGRGFAVHLPRVGSVDVQVLMRCEEMVRGMGLEGVVFPPLEVWELAVASRLSGGHEYSAGSLDGSDMDDVAR